MNPSLLKLIAATWLVSSAVLFAAEEEKKIEPQPPVETVVVKKREFHPETVLTGLAATPANATSVVTVPAEVKIKAHLVHPGQVLPAGAPLLALEPVLDFELAQSAAHFTTQALDSAQKRFDLKLISLADLLAAKQLAEEARLKLAHLLSGGLSPDGKLLLAPVAGVVDKLPADPGDTVAAGAPLVEMITADDVEVRGGLPAETVAEIGQKAKVTTLGRKTPLTMEGEVQSISRALNPETHLLDVRIRLTDPAGLHSGESLRVAISGPAREAVLVPKAALLAVEGETLVFTIRNGYAVRHVVELGDAEDDAVEITEGGIADGDIVVTTGNSQVSDGMAVALPGESKSEKKEKKTDGSY